MDPCRYPVGTKFKLNAKITDREGGKKFLYAYHGDPDVVVSDAEAQVFISGLASGHI
jgi:hypothetical protein